MKKLLEDQRIALESIQESESNMALGYEFCLIHVMWKIDVVEEKPFRRLLFAMVECFPTECTHAYEIPECGTKVANSRLYYVRLRRTVRDGVDWYKSILTNNRIPMIWQDSHIYWNFPNSSYDIVNNPAFPKLMVSQDLPYIGNCWGTVRCNHIYPTKNDPDLIDFVNNPSVAEWIADRLLWNLDEHIEFLGSVHLVMPNPIYSRISCRLLPTSDNKTSEEMVVKITQRNTPPKNAIKIFLAEKIESDIGNLQEYPLKDCFVVPLAGIADSTAYIVWDDYRGMLDIQSFHNFIRRIETNMKIGGTIRRVKPPSGNEYEVQVYNNTSSVTHEREDIPVLVLQELFSKIQHRRSQVEAGEKLKQRFFWKEHDVAVDFIREIISHATQKLIIIDPYFSVLELYDFVLAVTYGEIDIEIITSSEILQKEQEEKPVINNSLWGRLRQWFQVFKITFFSKRNSTSFKRQEVGDQMLDHVSNIISQDKTLRKIVVQVMVGKAVFHDRFIIIDDKEVWFSGNSLNSLGKKAGAIIQLPDPVEILNKLDKIRQTADTLLPLPQWLEKRHQNRRGN